MTSLDVKGKKLCPRPGRVEAGRLGAHLRPDAYP
jgi:hypothetical protein